MKQDNDGLADGEGKFSEEERAALHASIERGIAQMRAGQGRPAEEYLAELRQRSMARSNSR